MCVYVHARTCGGTVQQLRSRTTFLEVFRCNFEVPGLPDSKKSLVNYSCVHSTCSFARTHSTRSLHNSLACTLSKSIYIAGTPLYAIASHLLLEVGTANHFQSLHLPDCM